MEDLSKIQSNAGVLEAGTRHGTYRWIDKKLYKKFMQYVGPAFIVSVAYIDPGNFATNISGGSQFGYGLLWVILWSNLMAIFLQTLSCKLGIATGKTLPEMCRVGFSKRVNGVLWIVAEIAIIATYLAEFLGATLGFYLLFQLPMWLAACLTAIVTVVIAGAKRFGQKVVEGIIFFFVAIIALAYALEVFLCKPDWGSVAFSTLVPHFDNAQAVMIAVGMLGATVMPHVIYLHSQLVHCRNHRLSEKEKKTHLRFAKIDITIAMNMAFFVNAAMVVVSAATFFVNGIAVDSIEQAHQSLAPLLGNLSAQAFGIALLASGLSSSAVGAMAGDTVTEGFIGRSLPVLWRRIITMFPAFVIVLIGFNPMQALVLSQVALSFALPFAIIPLLLLTNQKKWMGNFANKKLTKYVGVTIISLIVALNIYLIYATLFM